MNVFKTGNSRKLGFKLVREHMMWSEERWSPRIENTCETRKIASEVSVVERRILAPEVTATASGGDQTRTAVTDIHYRNRGDQDRNCPQIESF